MSSAARLLRTRRFLPLFVTQFLGAFNDNTFKNALVVLLAFHAASWTTLAPGLLANLAAGIFILPFFLFSATAGQMADKYDKARLARAVKLLEVAIMAIAGVGFWLHSLAWLFAALFLLGLHSTLFGPVKYALLPQHLNDDELLAGNALVEAGTFVAILLGTLAGGLLAGTGQPWSIAAAGALIGAAGYLASRAIPSAPAPAPDLRIHPNPLTETWRTLGYARENRAVFQSILGISWFWLFGALFLAQFPAYAKDVLGGDEAVVTLLLATFSVGVGLGSLACEKLAAGRVEIGLVPLGSIGLSLFALDLALASPAGAQGGAALGLGQLIERPGTWRLLVDLALVGVFGGFFIVPLYALVQQRSHPERRARIIAGNNIVNALFMVVGALAAAGLLAAGWSIPWLFAAAALMNAAVAVYIYTRVPEFLIRFVVWLVLRVTSRVEAQGMEHVPPQGGALLVLECAAPIPPRDLLAVMAACERPIRFLLDADLARRPGYGLMLRHAKAIFADHVQAGRAALADGQLVGVAHNPIGPEMLRVGKEVPVFRVVVWSEKGRWAKTRLRLEPAQ
jgi:MFS family permease